MQQRLPSLLPTPIAFAHRGAKAHAPENTIAAFALALRLGATGLESDVWMTHDGQAVLDHDGVAKVRLRSRPISELNKAQLPAHIPTLDELFAKCGTDYQLSLDVKDVAAFDAVMTITRNHDSAMLERLWLCHYKLQVLLDVRECTQGAQLVDSTRLERIKEGPERRAATHRASGIAACNMHNTDWNGGLVALFHRFGVAAFSWDLQYEPALRNAYRMGIDAVYSDWVERMMDTYLQEVT